MIRGQWKKIVTGIALLVVAALLVGLMPACTPAPTPEQPMVLDMASWLPPATPDNKIFPEYFQGLEDATGGAVKVEIHAGCAMGPAAEHYDMALKGIADIAHFGPGYTPGLFPMLSMFELPLHLPSAELGTLAVYEMYKKGYFDDEFADVKLLGIWSLGPYLLYWADDRVTTVEAFKGLKVRCPSTGHSDVINALGGVAVSAPSSEMYMMQQKGIVDCAWGPWDQVLAFKYNEVSKYLLKIDLITWIIALVVNEDSWNALPKEAKEYLDDTSWPFVTGRIGPAFDEVIPVSTKVFLETPGREIIEMEPGELDKMDQVLAPLWTKWIADHEAQGLPAKEGLADLYDIFKGLGIERPFIGYTP